MRRELIDDILDPNFLLESEDYTNEDIETTCLHCGFTEKVPDFIYDEFSRKKYHLKIKKRVSTLTCNKCEKQTAIPASFLKN